MPSARDARRAADVCRCPAGGCGATAGSRAGGGVAREEGGCERAAGGWDDGASLGSYEGGCCGGEGVVEGGSGCAGDESLWDSAVVARLPKREWRNCGNAFGGGRRSEHAVAGR